MQRLKTLNDTSNELLIYRHGNGIHLVRPDQVKNARGFPISHTIESLFNLNLSIYFLDCESRMENANQANLEICGLDSLNQGRGKTAFDICRDALSKKLIKNDKFVIKQNKPCFFDESLFRRDDTYCGLSVKIPWYSNNLKNIGILGISIVSGIHSIATSLTAIQGIGLLDTAKPHSDFLAECFIDNIHFTRRELSILKHVVRGYSAYAIGNMLNISQRTVETHFHNIKIKLGVRSKAEVIQKIIGDNKYTKYKNIY